MNIEHAEMEGARTLLLTQNGMDRLKAELKHLTNEKRDEIADRIRESKDHGEFSEDNSELDEVKMEQAIVENRINELKTILSTAEVLDKKKVPNKVVGLGSRVKVKEAGAGFEFEVQIVASVEANPDEDLISDESPMGEALIGRAVGEKASFEAPAGRVEYEVLRIRR